MRIDKLLSQLKYGSRKEIQKAIKDQSVIVDGKVIHQKDYNVDPINQTIEYNGEEVVYYKRVVLMLNKPSGVVSANYDLNDKTVIDLIGPPYHRYDLKIAGRLDKDTEGLVILTDDGDLLHQIISPKKNVYKTYEITTEKNIDNIHDLLKPMRIKDGRDREYIPKRPIIESHQNNKAVIKISEGKFHQVKRMFEAINHHVIHLKRTAINALCLDVEIGEYRMLKEDEIKKLVSKENGYEINME